MSVQAQISGDIKIRDLEGGLYAEGGIVTSKPFGEANGFATLGGDGKVPSSQLPSYVDDVVEVANYAALPIPGETGKIYITLDTNYVYRWAGSTYVQIIDTSAVWGAITGTLSNQTDLQSALDAKVPYTGATGNVDLGTYGIKGDYSQFNLTPSSVPTTVGTLSWDSEYRTLQLVDGDGDTTLQIGQEQRTLVHNGTGSTLTDGQVVYVTGSTGELPSVALASNTSETTSSVTFGVVTESIANGADGFITTSGIVHGLNTLAFNEGDAIWLGSTAGTFTNVKPVAPANSVLVGYVIKKAGGNGSIFVKIQNGYELEELHDVLITSVANNQGIFWDSATSLWKNKTIAGALGYTPVPTTRSLTINGTAYDLSADRSWSVGTVTSVDLSVPNGFSVSGNPITSSGTLALGFASGYSLPTNVKQSNWDDAYTWVANFPTQTGNAGKFLTTDGSTLSWVSNPLGTVTSVGLSSSTSGVTIGSSPITTSGTITLAIATASGTQQGLLSSADWTTFNNKQNALTNPVTGTGTSGYVSFWNGTNTITGESNLFWDATNDRLGIGLTNPQRSLEIYSATADSHLRLSGSAPSVSMGEAITGSIYQAKFGLATANGQYASGAVAGDFVILSQTGATIFMTNATEKMRVNTSGRLLLGTTTDSGELLQVAGTAKFTGALSGTSATFSGLTLSSASTPLLQIVDTTNSKSLLFGADDNNTFIRSSSSTPILFQVNGGDTALTLASNQAATFSSSLRIGGATGNFIMDSYTASKIGIRSWTDAAGTTNNFFVQNNANYNYGVVGVVSASGTSTGDVYGLGYTPSAGTSMTPVLNWTSAGNVGIGTTNPQNQFVVSNANGNFEVGPGATVGVISYNRSTSSWIPMAIDASKLTLNANTSGNVLIGTTTDAGYKLYVNGSVAATSGFFDTSDKRLKKEITDNPTIKGIESIKPKLYVKADKEELGYYAQDLQEVLPSAVSEGSDGFLSLSYAQVHTAKIAQLEDKIAQLEELIKKLL